ncbi:MAG: glycosyltransferase family 2 protein [Phycisphaerales bacterium]
MIVSVIIPTYARAAKLAACVRALARQTFDPRRFEVLVSVDGPDAGEAAAVRDAAGGTIDATVLAGPRQGPAAARNRAIARARGSLLLLLNDDVIPAPDLIARHAETHESLAAEAVRTGRDGAIRPAMILGSAPWVVHRPDRLFDRLIRETSMVFFYDRMGGAEGASVAPNRDWGFRHAWTLNLSVPTAVVREVGGFSESLPSACYEDLEWAWRVRERFGSPVLYRPAARVEHDHRYEPAAYLERERTLGADAFRLAAASPACARAVFGRDVDSPDELAYSRAFVERERAAAERLELSFLALADLPASAVDGPHAARLVTLIYEQHLLLKRWHWRRGLLEAAGSVNGRGQV